MIFLSAPGCNLFHSAVVRNFLLTGMVEVIACNSPRLSVLGAGTCILDRAGKNLYLGYAEELLPTFKTNYNKLFFKILQL